MISRKMSTVKIEYAVFLISNAWATQPQVNMCLLHV